MNKDEMKMIEEMATHMVDYCDRFQMCPYDADSNVTCDICKARSLYNANCRIIADDEIVIKKSEYEELKTHIEDLQTKLVAVMLCIKNTHEIDISDLLRKQEQETARDILQELKNRKDDCYWADDVAIMICELLPKMANKYGIELE